MSKRAKVLLLGFTALVFAVYFALIGMAPRLDLGGGSGKEIHLPKPEELGVVLPASSMPAASSDRSGEIAGDVVSHRSGPNRLNPPPEVRRHLEKDGSIVY